MKLNYKYIIALFVSVILPLMCPSVYALHVITITLLYAFLASSWSLLADLGGLISFGHAAFFGLGAYVSTLLYIYYGVSPWVGMLAGIIVVSILGFFISYTCVKFKVRGIFFALVPLALSLIFQQIFISYSDFTGGSLGITIPYKGFDILNFQFPTKIYYYYIFLIFFLSLIYGVRRIKNSRWGYILSAISQDEDAAESIGIDVTKNLVKLAILSFCFMSVGGTLFAQYYLYINPEVVFGSNVSLSFALMGLLGGVKESLGPIVGSFLYITISEILRVSFGASGSAIAWVIFGSLVFIFASFAREGVSAYFRKLVTSRKPYTVNKHKAKRNFYIEE